MNMRTEVRSLVRSGVDNKKNDAIELIRFLAALMVVFEHVPVVKHGYWGVDIFFVISGLVMMLSTESGGKEFFLKRLIRILPTYWLFTLGVYVVALVKPTLLGSTTSSVEHLVKSLLFVPFDKNGSGHYPILFLGWTLNFEMVFYLLFAIALKLDFRFRGIVVAVLVTVLTIACSYASDYPFKVYANSVILDFILGLALYQILFRRDYRQFIALVLIYLMPLAFGYATILSRGYVLGAPAFAFCGVILLIFGRVRVPRPVVFMGGASYALYLTHPYVIQFFDKVTGWFADGVAMAVLATVVAVLLCFALAAAIYLFVEMPSRKFLRAKLVGGSEGAAAPAKPG